MKPSDVTVVIAALNEELSIGTVVKSIVDRLPEAEIIVVDDGSDDSTAETARRAGAKVIRHGQTNGYGSSLKTGVKASSRDFVLFCDGDGQHSAEDVERLIEACNGFDMVVGKRSQKSHLQLSRRPGKFILRKFANFLAGQKIPDLNSGLRIVNKDILLRYMHLMSSGFSFSTTTTFAFLKTNRNIKYLPITTKKRIGSSSVRQWKHGPQTLMLVLRLTVLFEPLKVFLSFSGLLLFLSFVSFAIDIFFGDKGISDTTVTLSISTLIVFLFGLLCDQVSSLRREIHD